MRLTNKGTYGRELITIKGKIRFSRTILVPADIESAKKLFAEEGIKSVAPVDAALGIDKIPFKVTARMICEIVKEAVRNKSYSDAAEGIYKTFHVDISPDQIRRITDYAGDLVFASDLEKAEYAKLHENDKIDRRKRRHRKNDVLYLETDGAMVNTRVEKEGSSWMECKMGMAFNERDIHRWTSKKGEPCHSIMKREFIGFIGSANEFMYHFLAMAKRNESDYCSEVVIISDGAIWIQNMVKQHFPNATHILDLYHAKENACKFASFIYAGSPEKAKAASVEWCDMIENGKAEELIEILKPYEGKKMPPGILNLHTYLSNHHSCMNYPEYKRKGYFVGSGAQESANKYVMQNRMKLQGMRWNKRTGQGMLSLKAKYEADRWNEVEQLIYEDCSVNKAAN